MTNPIRDYVATLDREICVQIIKDTEQLERDGFIGDSVIREHAQHVRDVLLNANNSMITLWMNQLAFEVFRRFTYEMNQIL